MSVTAVATAIDRDMRIKNAYAQRITALEVGEQEAWAKYSGLSRAFAKVRAAHEAKRATKADVKVARLRATRAHRNHQRFVSEIGLMHRLYIGWRVGRG